MRPICIDANVFIASIYLETALKHHAVFVTLDDVDFLSKIKDRVGIDVYHPKDFP